MCLKTEDDFMPDPVFPPADRSRVVDALVLAARDAVRRNPFSVGLILLAVETLLHRREPTARTHIAPRPTTRKDR